MKQERRRYFRVEADCIVTFKAVTADEKKEGIAQLNKGDRYHPDKARLFLKLDADLQDGLSRIRQKLPDVAAMLDLLNRKINLIAEESNSTKLDGLLDQQPQRISLSACGIAFQVEHPMEVESDIEWDLILLPDQTYIHGYGHVVACETAHEGYLIRVNFDALREEDLERLLHYIMRKESEWMRTSHGIGRDRVD
ncbi:MAG: PilZ domain-containing protein [Gammaproteobacteria bacterium]